MANPFDLLPPNLFNLFSTQGYISLQRHYMAILLRIYELAEFNPASGWRGKSSSLRLWIT